MGGHFFLEDSETEEYMLTQDRIRKRQRTWLTFSSTTINPAPKLYSV